jgi:multiple sugar transport system substrate-binding protein
VTRQEGGVQYKGVLPGNVSLMARGLSLSYVDPATNKAAVNNDKWKNLFELASSMYKIPGNMPKDPKQLFNLEEFFKDKVLAMVPFYSTLFASASNLGNDIGFDWDFTTYPSFEPGKTAEIDTTYLLVNSASKHKDEAFQAIQYLTTSTDVQENLAKVGEMPAVQLGNYEEVFGANYPILKQKNLKGALKAATRTPHHYNRFDDVVRSKVDNIFINQYLTGKMDTNTALRTIEEQANKTIEEKKQ